MINVIIGPTASGKSALAVDRSRADPSAVIINADAMQCYDALPILTAQPTPAERAGIPHALYGILDAAQTCSAADWVTMATNEINAALAKNQKPYLVGGTGFYIKSLMDGLSPIPNIAPDVRAGLMARLDEQGLPALYAELGALDPVIATRLKPSDTQRIIRALEVYEGTGTPLSAWQDMPLQKPSPDWTFHVIHVSPDKEILDKKIRARLQGMMDAGVMDEVKSLSDRIDNGDVSADAAITIAHGFRYLRSVLKNEMSLDAALERTAIETRQYTKRQRTWLRHQIKADEMIS